jgi:acetyl esterase/lipase
MATFVHRAALGFVAALTLTAFATCVQAGAATPEEVIRLWPGTAPGSEGRTGNEVSKEAQANGIRIHIKANVSVPTVTVVRPKAGKANGTGMLVLPGGAFMALAWDLEGTEVADWLAERGITAFILKYRVSDLSLAPGEAPPTAIDDLIRRLQPNRKIAVADASQAIRLVRQNAARYGIRPDRIGMIGFSAGAITTMGVLLEGDPAARPNFAAPIYGMTMIGTPTVPADAPPLFIAAAQDDTTVPATGSIDIFNLWTKARRPAELHIYEKGGHGFGMRPSASPVGKWPAALEAWLRSQGLLTSGG